VSAVPRTRRDDVTVPARGHARRHDLAEELGDNVVVGRDEAWRRALELAWESFCAGTTPVCAVVTAVQSTITQLRFAGRDPYGGASGLAVDTLQARRRPLAAPHRSRPPARLLHRRMNV
jgi:hypothetical protein